MITRRTCLSRTSAALLISALGPRALLAQEQSVTDAYNASGHELFKRRMAGSGNIVFSPYSIGSAMAMALCGARGATEAEMAKVLRLTRPRAAIAADNAKVFAILNGYDRSSVPPECPDGTKFEGGACNGARGTTAAKIAPSARLSVANGLALTRAGARVSPDYIALLQAEYGAEVFRNAQLAEVNAWVHRKTEGKIEKILEVLDPSAAAVLLNAVYFKASWLSAFAKRDTRDEAFNLTASTQAKVPMMHKTASYGVAVEPGFRAIRLPYAVSSLGMVVVVPDKFEGVNEVGAGLDAVKLAQLKTAFRSRRVELALPRFKTSFGADLVPSFQAAGMRLAFSNNADFSGITGAPNAEAGLKIGQIAHRAVIEVEEEGTEAAAATAIVMVPTAAIRPPQDPEFFRVDRPFLFYLVDDTTGAILFQGRINDPR